MNFKHGDPIEKYNGRENTILLNTEYRFSHYTNKDKSYLEVIEFPGRVYRSENFRPFIECKNEPVKRKIQVGDLVKNYVSEGILISVDGPFGVVKINEPTYMMINVNMRDLTIIKTCEELEQEKMTDLSKYKSFPAGYKIPEGVKVVLLSEMDGAGIKINVGENGRVLHLCPSDKYRHFVKWGSDAYFSETHKLAPANPADHPDYQKPITTDQKQQCSGIDEKLSNFSVGNSGIRLDENNYWKLKYQSLRDKYESSKDKSDRLKSLFQKAAELKSVEFLVHMINEGWL